MTPADILALLRARGFSPKRSLGQNFLVDPGLLGAVADAGQVGPRDLVVEVGMGAGTLTSVLAARAAKVVTFEVDRHVAEVARTVLEGRANVEVVLGDALRGEEGLHPALEAALASATSLGLRAKVVANFPYAIVTPLVVRLLERSVLERAFPLAVIAGMVQREAADRLTAREITKAFGAPSALVQVLASTRMVRKVSPRAFLPPPKVDSAVIVATPFPSHGSDDAATAAAAASAPATTPPRAPAPPLYAAYRDLVRAAFQQRRKTIRGAIERAFPALDEAAVSGALAKAGVDPQARVEQLSVPALLALARAAGE